MTDNFGDMLEVLAETAEMPVPVCASWLESIGARDMNDLFYRYPCEHMEDAFIFAAEEMATLAMTPAIGRA